MKINNQQISLEKNEVLNSFIVGMNIYSLEQRSDKLFLVRENRKTLSMHTVFAEAEDKFGKLKATKKGGEKMTDGEKKFKEAGEKLKAEKAAAEEQALEAKEAALNQLAQIKANPNLAQMYADNANVGTENLGGTVPYLKVHATGKSTKNFLSDGKKPTDGYFFYTPTQEEFKTLDVHILTISKGFRMESMPDENGYTRMVFNQIVAGVFKEDFKPFVLMLSGKKLSPMWEFGEKAGRYTRVKPFGIPMFALTVNMTTEESANTKGGGYSWIIKFDIVKESDGSPVLITDVGKFQFLRTLVDDLQDRVNALIGKVAKGAVQEIIEPTPSLPIPEEGNAHIGAQDIPFD